MTLFNFIQQKKRQLYLQNHVRVRFVGYGSACIGLLPYLTAHALNKITFVQNLARSIIYQQKHITDQSFFKYFYLPKLSV